MMSGSRPRIARAGSRTMKHKILLGLVASLGWWSVPAWSAFVTLHEDRLEELFSQTGFPGPTDIVYDEVRELLAPDLLQIDNLAEWSLLNSLASGQFMLGNSVPLFFVDKLRCGNTGGFVAGCASTSHAVVNSGIAAGSTGDELVAHELGHVFSLTHFGTPGSTAPADPNDPSRVDPNNLMKSNLSNNVTVELVPAQITQLLGSPWVFDTGVAGGHMISIAPILVVAAAASVPLPVPVLLLMSALIPLMRCRRNRGA
jgi:hypothetical protein